VTHNLVIYFKVLRRQNSTDHSPPPEYLFMPPHLMHHKQQEVPPQLWREKFIIDFNLVVEVTQNWSFGVPKLGPNLDKSVTDFDCVFHPFHTQNSVPNFASGRIK